jgi:PAS domain S-box-containing protein
MTDRDSALPDLTQCEAEPIHIPGAIQPHGVLLALDATALRILQASRSAWPLLGVPAERLLGRGLAEALDSGLAAAVEGALARCHAAPDDVATFDWSAPADARAFVAHVHLSGRTPVLELEASAAADGDLGETIATALRELGAIRREPDLDAKLAAATVLFRRLTGYDRVMVYRFDEDWHGAVVAEARRPDLEPYLGLHFPASDIPSQARQVFAANPCRVILDVDYVPSPLEPLAHPATGKPLDLSRSVLRSVSPVHLEYLRNMRVGASMSLSLLQEGRLWGLIACHHKTPHAVPARLREIAAWLAQDLATQIALTEHIAERQCAAHLEACRERVIFLMRQGARLPALLEGPELANVLGAIGADGVALIRGDEVITGGATPDPRQILDIADGLSTRHPNSPSRLFATDCLSEQLPELAGLADTAAGVALFPLEAAQSIKLMWFRGEQLREVTWGGNPDKAMHQTPDGRLSPRRSFSVWREIVRLHSRRWRQAELESARKLGALIDIEWRQMAEEALREHEALLTDVLDSLTAHIAVLDEQGRITAVNAAWRRYAGRNGGGAACLPGADYLGVCRQALSVPDNAEALQTLEGLERVLSGAACTFSRRYPCASPTEPQWFEMRVFALSGARSGAVVAHEDITAQVRAEQALKRSEERLREAAEEALRLSQESFRLAVDNLPDGLVIYDEHMCYRFVNPVCLQRSGLPLAAYLGRRDDEIFPPAVHAEYLPRLRETYATRAATTFESALTLASGRYDLMVTYVPMLEHGRVYQVFGFYRDITERKQSEAKLAEQARQLYEADWRKDEFLAMLAHELRNPLAPIANAVRLLRRGAAAAELDWCLAVIDRQTAHLTRLVDDLLDISRISRGIIELRPEPLDLADILGRALETSGPAIAARRHRLQFDPPPELLRVHGDLVRLTQVVSNLLTNAAKFTEEGGQIDLSVEAGAQEIAIRVRDSGRGIDQAQLSLLFDLFFQVDGSIARMEGGLGIGLSLAKRLVEMHGGTIEVHSEGRGRGSEFCVRLPRLDAHAAARLVSTPAGVGAAPNTALGATPPAGGLRVLVVDDNRDAIDSLELLVGGEGYEVLVAYDGESAVSLATTMQPDVVLLDIGLPGMDGYAVARTLRQRFGPAALLIVAVTGYGQPESRERSRAAGFDLHLVKPIDFDGLLGLLAEYRAKGQGPRAEEGGLP